MAWIPAAIAAGGSLLGGAMGSDAAGDAASASVKAEREKIAFQKWLYEQQVGMSEPFRATGLGANNMLAQLYGLPYMPYESPNLGGSGGPSGTSATVGQSGFGDPLPLPDPLGLFGSSGRTASWGSDNLLTAKNIVKMLKNGQSIEDISKLGFLESSLNPRRVNKLSKAGLSTEDILRLQQGPAGPPKAPTQPITPTGPDMSVFQNSPGYQFRKQEGMNNLGNSFAARGGAFSGNALRGLTDFNQNLASDDFYNFVNQMNNMAGRGQTATSQTQNAGSQFGYQTGNAMSNIGDARASGIANQGNIWGNALGGAANAFGNYWGNRNQPRSAGSNEWGL